MPCSPASLLNSLEDQLKSSKFRWINEKLYTCSSQESLRYFKAAPELFTQYHEGFSRQVTQWPVNPLNLIIEELSDMMLKRPKLFMPLTIVDLGCGEGKLELALRELGANVHSFDLVSDKPHVRSVDIANLPLPSSSVDVAVFCLSLMGTNWPEFIKEATRVVKDNGTIYIAEVVSRFRPDSKAFIDALKTLGLCLVAKNEKNTHFIILTFKKKHSKGNARVPASLLKPCIYKKR